MNYVTISQLNNDIKNNLYKITDDIDLIVGIPRSGMLVANLIALYINKPLTDIDSFLNGKIYSSGSTKNLKRNIKDFSEVKKILIVEDSSNSGKSVVEAKEKLKSISNKYNIIYFAMYVTNESKKNVDIYGRVIGNPRVFEWNLMHHSILNRSCVDIDGVLCFDPTPEQNDDGEKYIDFILNAVPKLIPTQRIKYIVTSRLEKYRKYTEEWLKKNNVEYDYLIMMNVATAEERRKLNNHGKFKALIYKEKKDAVLFIESEQSQAETISLITKKSVICIDDNNCFKGSRKNNFIYKFKVNLKNILKKILPKKIVNKIRKKHNEN